MGLRYRKTDWRAAKRDLPPDLAPFVAVQIAPPGFVKLSFGSEAAETWVRERLGEPLEAPYGVSCRTKWDKQANKWPKPGVEGRT